MTDISSSFGGDVGKIKGTDFDRNVPVSSGEQQYCAPHKEIDNLDNAHSALVGRSMVKKFSGAPKFDGKIVESVKKDLAALDANYAKNKKSVAIEDLALQKLSNILCANPVGIKRVVKRIVGEKTYKKLKETFK